MSNNQYDTSTKEARILRAEGGDYIKRCRLDAGMTQRDLAEALNLKYYTFISQVENGQGRLPPYLYVKTARALGLNIKEFSITMLSYYDPHTHSAITVEEEFKKED
jgi:transcriptional regulator with XRE-family HTH domain